jgi:hypothetical protein
MNIYRFYVYAYLRENGTPYYIGKGCNSRAYGKHHKIPVPKNTSRIVFLETKLSELGAFALERRYIRWYGRKDIGTGILRNRTDGGEGSSGIVYTEERRNKVIKANTGRKISEKTLNAFKEANKNRVFSEEHRAKISLANSKKRKPLSEEHRAKISATKKAKTLLLLS